MLLLCIAIAGGIALLDVAFKQFIEDNVEAGQTRGILKDKVEVRKVHNYGFAMNLLEKKHTLVKFGSAAAGIVLAIYELCLFIKKRHPMEKIGGALALGGAFSNIYDRMVRGYVVDYFGFKTKWKKLAKLTFNIGDVCIALGAVLVAVFGKKD